MLMSVRVLIIDDDSALCYGLKRLLSDSFDVHTALNGSDALDLVKKNKFNIIFLDYKLGEENGLEVLKAIKKIDANVPVVMMTAYGTSNLVLDSIKLGAVEYIVKPVEPEYIVEIATKIARIDNQEYCPENALKLDYESFSDEIFIGSSKAIRDIMVMVAGVAETNYPVLVTGESGTGKELIVKIIHKYSDRKEKPFIPINCAAIPEELLESELFGYEKGAFTGADKSKMGKFEIADGGTLFLDEIGDMPLDLQAKLLRVLQDGAIERLGSNKLKKVNVRIVAATNKDLKELIQKGLFREDLYYRLNVVNINLPPLRERKEDIKDLAVYFTIKYSKELNKSICCIEDEVFNILLEYDWPGNVRELENVIRKAVLITKDNLIKPEDIKIDKIKSNNVYVTEYFFNKYKDNLLVKSVEEIEARLIKRALKMNGYNLSKTAEILGISRVTLNAKLKKYEIKI
ncbi:two-component, sigma54 specific, transcriptional regulator [Deferribacter desulfuricans SSM1]|uniref:Two-component, sigma54 specific, transcriptional regulator n=2 Tax=Deferribacter TaxID=53572 RepID=D3PE91_DEFDS|nr:two-component, sigma54 specific, transcriptional regulator [Deferribacter desulfuricans SSM1]